MRRVALVGFCLCLSGAFSHEAQADYPLGTVLVTLNPKAEANTSPGYYNHLSIYVGHGFVVESQADRGVILTGPTEYNSRKYLGRPRKPRDLEMGRRAAAEALKLVGLPYNKFGSLGHFPHRGLNCVGVIRLAYARASGHDLRRLMVPDDIFRFDKLFYGDQPTERGVSLRRRADDPVAGAVFNTAA